ncbi:MAG: hypothetical protein KGZ38_00955 [Erysipelothrix sp.]|nr:hypothetical protein [Erysipelothrix sp.]
MSQDKSNKSIQINFDNIQEVKVKMDLYNPGSHKEKLRKGYKGFKLRKEHNK